MAAGNADETEDCSLLKSKHQDMLLYWQAVQCTPPPASASAASSDASSASQLPEDNQVMPWLQFWFDYDPTTYRAHLLPFDAIRHEQKWTSIFRRSCIAGELNADRNCESLSS